VWSSIRCIEAIYTDHEYQQMLLDAPSRRASDPTTDDPR
jgi:hypothetical protein